MDFPILIAQIAALIYLPLGIALISGQIDAKKLTNSFQKSPGLSLMIGVFGLIFGLIILHFHNVWVKDWTVLVTLLGWIGVIEGVIFIAFQKNMLSLQEKMAMKMEMWGWLAVVMGLVFGYFGFLA